MPKINASNRLTRSLKVILLMLWCVCVVPNLAISPVLITLTKAIENLFHYQIINQSAFGTLFTSILIFSAIAIGYGIVQEIRFITRLTIILLIVASFYLIYIVATYFGGSGPISGTSHLFLAVVLKAFLVFVLNAVCIKALSQLKLASTNIGDKGSGNEGGHSACH